MSCFNIPFALWGVLALGLSFGLLRAAPAVVVEDENALQAGFSTKLELSYEAKGGATRQRKIYLWYPTENEAAEFRYGGQRGVVSLDAPVIAGRHPLILFSHGFWGGADQSVFLMEALARAGYIVASLHHDDAIPNHREKPVAMPNFVAAKTWDDGMFFDRKEDMSALLDRLLELDEQEGSMLEGRLAREAIGAVGHSLGGYTVLGMAGARKTWKDERVSAAVLLSPYILPYFHHGTLKEVKIPVMFQGGTLDLGVTPFLKRIYDKLTAPKYYLVLKGVTHFGWTDLIAEGRLTTEVLANGSPKLIADYSRAFFDHHLRGEKPDEALEIREMGLQDRDKELHAWWATPEVEAGPPAASGSPSADD